MKLWIFSGYTESFKIEPSKVQDFGNFELSPMHNDECPSCLCNRVKKVESLEELRDVYNHFLLYYGTDIVNMRNAEKTKKNEEEREKNGEEGADEEKEHQETIKQASRKSGYTICVKNKLGMYD